MCNGNAITHTLFNMEHIALASQIITSLRRTSSKRLTTPWVIWREILGEIYGYEIDISTIEYHVNVGKVEAQKLPGTVELFTLIQNSAEEDKTKVLKLVCLYIQIEKSQNEFQLYKAHKEIFDDLVKKLQISTNEITLLERVADDWLEKYKNQDFKTVINTPASLFPISLDFSLRWIVLWLYQSENFGSLGEGNQIFFAISQLIFIPILVTSFCEIRNRMLTSKISGLLKENDLGNIQLVTRQTAWDYTLLVTYVIMGAFITLYTVGDGSAPALAGLLMALVYGSYLLIILKSYSRIKPTQNYIISQLAEKKIKDVPQELSHDENDEEIVNLEVRLRSVSDRMDAFVLEAALLGALSFSGFLQVISMETFTLKGIEIFSDKIFQLAVNIAMLSSKGNNEIFQYILTKDGLISLMCFQTLFCSIFFLSVIGSRLRFNDLIDLVDRSLLLAKSYNEKEEDLLSNQNKPVTDERVQHFNKKIRQSLKDGSIQMQKIEPILDYMSFFRTMGIGAFFIIIITAGLFLSVGISFIFCFVFILSMVYFRLGKVLFNLRSFSIALQEAYFSKYKMVVRTGVALLIVAFLLRSFHMPMGDMIMVVAFLTIVFHFLFSMLLPNPALAENVLHKDPLLLSRAIAEQIRLNKLFKIGIALLLLGYMFRMMHWPGAGPLLVLGCISLAGYFLLSVKKMDVAKWVRIITSIGLGLSMLALLFNLMHWPGWPGMCKAGFGLLLITLIMMKKNWNLHPGFIKRSVIILLVVTGSIVFDIGPIRYTMRYFKFDYSAYLSYQESNLLFRKIKITEYSDPLTKSDLDSLYNYSARYSQIEKNADKLNSAAWHFYENYDDPKLLRYALGWSKTSLSKHQWPIALDTYARLLFKLKEYEKANKSSLELLEMINIDQDKKFYQDTEKLIQQISDSLMVSSP